MKPLDYCCLCQRPLSIHALFTHFSSVSMYVCGDIFKKKEKFPPLLIYFRFLLTPISLPFVSLSSLQVIMCKVLTGAGGAWSMES